jgi:hypothetical protein
MSAILLHSGKTEHFRALGETGQPVYHSALQLRKVISRRLPGKERHLAVPQRDQEGEGVDWYSGIPGDVIPWSSATEDEREDARIQLEAFRQEVIALNQAPPEGQGGDHEVFTRLVKWVSHFPDENYVYLVDDTPVITFWGFIHPEADRHANPLLCLSPSANPEETPPTPPMPAGAPVIPATPEPKPEPVLVTPARPWWWRWWWLLPLALALGLLLFGIRACTSQDRPLPPSASLGGDAPDVSLPHSLWQGWNIWPFNRLGGGSVSAPTRTAPDLVSPGLDGDPSLPAPPPRTEGVVSHESQPEVVAPPEILPDAVVSHESRPEGVVPPEILPGVPVSETPDMPPPTLEPLRLPAEAPDGTAEFLNGNWRGAGVMDSQSGLPVQVTYVFEQGEGTMYIRRGGSAGMTCAGPVSAAMQSGQLQVEAQERARCEDGSHYEMPRVQCHQADGESASCAASYDDEPFPMQLRKAS